MSTWPAAGTGAGASTTASSPGVLTIAARMPASFHYRSDPSRNDIGPAYGSGDDPPLQDAAGDPGSELRLDPEPGRPHGREGRPVVGVARGPVGGGVRHRPPRVAVAVQQAPGHRYPALPLPGVVEPVR